MEDPRKVFQPTWFGSEPRRGVSGWGVYPVALLILLVVLAIANHQQGLDVPSWWTITFGVCVAVGGCASAVGSRFEQFVQAFMLVASVLIGAWIVWTGNALAWRSGHLAFTLASWAVMTPVLSLAAYRMRWRQHRTEVIRFLRSQAGEQEREQPRRSSEAKKWEDWFAEKGAKGVTFERRYAAEAGPVIEMGLPQDGSVTFSRVQNLQDALEVFFSAEDETITPGSVKITRKRIMNPDGQTSRNHVRLFEIRIDAVAILSRVLPLPEEHTPRSIKDAFRLGQYKDGTWFTMTMREIHWVITGSSGNGKSNLAHVMIFQISRCYDAVIWCIDLKQGETARPWLRAFFDRAIDPKTGRPVNPIIDWVAIDPYEAGRLWQAVTAIAHDRYGNRDGGNKTEPSAEQPQIILLIEEASLLVGQNARNKQVWDATGLPDFRTLDDEGLAIFRSAAVTEVKYVQTNSVTSGGSGDGDQNIKGRITFGAGDHVHARMTAKSYEAAKAATGLVFPGTFMADDSTSTARPEDPIKAYFVGDGKDFGARIYRASVEHSELIGYLPEGGREEQIANEFGYATRWTDDRRSGWWKRQHFGPWKGLPYKEEKQSAQQDAPGKGVGEKDEFMELVETQDLGGMPEQAGAEDGARVSFMDPTEFLAKVEQRNAGRNPSNGLSKGQQATYDVILAAGGSGISHAEITRQLKDALVVSDSGKSQVSRWLLRLAELNLIEKANGESGLYYPRVSLQAAA